MKNNVILVGDPGVGKTAIAEGLAFNIVNETCPAFLKGYEVYNPDIGAMLAGSNIEVILKKDPKWFLMV